MGFSSEGPTTLADALRQTERVAEKTKLPPDLDKALEIALAESERPAVAEAWRDVELKFGAEDSILSPCHKVAALVLDDAAPVQPQAAGHALVQACRGGHILCVRRLREIQNEHLGGLMLVGYFNAFAFLKAVEAGHDEVVEEFVSKPIMSASTAMMGYVVATKWKDKDPASSYPFVEQPDNIPTKDWMQKLWSTKSMLPPAGPSFQSGGWDVRGLPGVPENLHEIIRASYTTYLLWRASVIAAAHCHTGVFRTLLNKRALDNSSLAASLVSASSAVAEAKKIVSDRAKMDTLMYQLVEEYSTKNYHDAMLYTLWGHIQRTGPGRADSPQLPESGKPRCVAQAQNGLWEMQLEVPLLMMPVEYALQDEEPHRRYKQLTLVYTQRAKVNIQLIATVEAQPSFLQVTVGVKHVRFKAENSRWDETCMGHFPTVVSLSVTPQTKEGTSVTMTNSSSNNTYKVGKAENISVGTGANDGATRGLSAGLRASAGITVNSTVKSTPWRFEQLPMHADDRGGSFVWTLQAMKGIVFDRSNPHRMAETNSMWKWGRRVPGNPLDELPFTSEGGVIFTGTEFTDTMMWRFPKKMEGRNLRWSIEGQIHSTFTTSRYFETRMASFCGDIEERLQPMEVKIKDKDKVSDKDSDKQEKGNKSEPAKGPTLDKFNTTMKNEFLEWLEFKKYQEAKSKGLAVTSTEEPAKIEKVESAKSVEAAEPVVTQTQLVENGSRYTGGIEEKKEKNMKLILDLDEGLESRPSLSRVTASKGMWLDSSDTEMLSPPHQPHVGGLLRSIEEEDLYQVPDGRSERMSGKTSDTGDQSGRRISGLSVRTRSREHQR